ncbi:tail protein X [Chryseobacterium sp. 7]|jgi:phage tail protein X|uniref:tail protein X n=1 Tax=Chryseobacterium sp. 7 TaxID=2035214 RepID=UPI000EAEA2E0|nr:tail protein X [Chryseobacterium sp. 7]RLJ34222.1 tail protein X [Chryseobacterium sp. 7]
MADTIQYITQDGERWDSISWKMYGTVREIPRLISANPQVPISERLKAGTVLVVPVLESYNLKTDKDQLPPWKQ